MSDPIETLMLANLLAVFNERDEKTRRPAIERTYAPDVRWTDAEGVSTGHDALEAKCVALQNQLGDQQFAAAGPVHVLPDFGYLAWNLVDPTTGQTGMSGFDAAVIKDGRIAELYTVLIPPS
ncbi:nuclear transport factor 2 family protein [Mycolicibacterium tusciae]|jgi:hypothetical protein|uniref:SnoaL-like domain-containing protein n=1 Tax=Mycolicibacterium tusciae TaxID=75922 RepID=A0A1X0JPP0_9MYCO|nr:nuclear transport factor 2 family protein [Mycolicibacterium tusciae]ORB64732.1 hypothetical protein BST47_15700 [Mycolicibacterium tusciae]